MSRHLREWKRQDKLDEDGDKDTQTKEQKTDERLDKLERNLELLAAEVQTIKQVVTHDDFPQPGASEVGP